METFRIARLCGESVTRPANRAITNWAEALRIARAASQRRGETIEVWTRPRDGHPAQRIAAYLPDGDMPKGAAADMERFLARGAPKTPDITEVMRGENAWLNALAAQPANDRYPPHRVQP